MPSSMIAARALSPAARNPSARARRRRVSRAPAWPIARRANGSASAVRRNLSRISARCSARSGPSRLLVGVSSIARSASSRLLRSACIHAVSSGTRKLEIAVLALDRHPWERPLGPAPPDFVGDHQDACVAAQLLRRNRPDQLDRQVHAPCADRLGEGLAGEILVFRLSLDQRRQQRCGARMVARHRRGARLDVGETRRCRAPWTPRRRLGARPAAFRQRPMRRGVYMFG